VADNSYGPKKIPLFKENAMAKWDLVCRPKEQGGLGVLNLILQNKALLIKNLYKFYNHHDIPWVNLIWHAYYRNSNTPHGCQPKGSFWWKDCLELLDIYKNLPECSIGSEIPSNYGKTNGRIE
jgi:hypothetical protein